MIKKLLKQYLGENYSNNNMNLFIFNIILVICTFVFSAIMIKFLPHKMPMQWDSNGDVTYTLPSSIAAFIYPVLLLFVNLIFLKQKRINLITSAAFIIISMVVAIYYLKIAGILLI
ncbi:DUF1648 domain-containing protein [Clostridium botulinum C]|uniref:DUF1648 domain-containing protein n=1 Tax=Clostridium botulinum TaxID=1491 RepID=UPI001E40EA73|nr:DUF1648 domain-containing protein [Clostridium botulinum]MCD3218126.1 DUF1648 domain-containing protein [Clostridium botulinum C]